jgi:hypothetical protein
MAQPCTATGHHQEEEAESALTPDTLSLGIDDICELSASLMSEGHPTREASEQPGMLHCSVNIGVSVTYARHRYPS